MDWRQKATTNKPIIYMRIFTILVAISCLYLIYSWFFSPYNDTILSANRIVRDNFSNEVSYNPSTLNIRAFNIDNNFTFWFDSNHNVEGNIRRLDIAIKDYSDQSVEWNLPVNVLYKLYYHFNRY